VWTYSGVRPLLDDESGDPSAVTRDYALELDSRQAPLLSVWGGKLTTFRKLAEEVGDLLAKTLKLRGGRWTAGTFLPGGDLQPLIGATQRPDVDFDRLVDVLKLRYPDHAPDLLRRLARAYGSRATALLDRPLGAAVAGDLHEGELQFLHDEEWARSADDVLWRRSKLGLHFSAAQRDVVAQWCRGHWSNHAESAPDTSAVREGAWS
jgi:glycerol-3-phosphate dehydrogenase